MTVAAFPTAIRKSVFVDAPPETAWRVFTDGISTWWPLDSHSLAAVHDEEPGSVVLEAREGGRLFELSQRGEQRVWGEILACEAPHRLVYTWHPGYARGAPMTEVEVRFEPERGGTRVAIEHRGWERLGDAAAEKQAGYDEGWEHVLGCFAEATPS